MVDTLASGASDRKVVEVRVLSWAPNPLALTPLQAELRYHLKYAIDSGRSVLFHLDLESHFAGVLGGVFADYGGPLDGIVAVG